MGGAGARMIDSTSPSVVSEHRERICRTSSTVRASASWIASAYGSLAPRTPSTRRLEDLGRKLARKIDLDRQHELQAGREPIIASRNP